MKIHIVDIFDPQNYERKDWDQDGIMIFSDEWADRQEQCQNYIDAVSGKHSRKIHGRKCEIKRVDSFTAREFLDKHHIQGSNNLSVVFFGLFSENELVAIMSLGRHSRQIAQNRIVLDRFCVKAGVHIPGGASKLFAQCKCWAIEQKYDEIISFSDNRWGQGNVYKALEFTLERDYKPDYSYADPTAKVRLSKQSQKKSSVNCPKDMTEFEWAKARGLCKVYDRGKKRWVYSLNPDHKTWSQKMSANCAAQNSDGLFKHSHRRGYFPSVKNGCDVYFGSSYELRCVYLMEDDATIKSYGRFETIRDEISGYFRNPDFKVEFMDGIMELREVKPEGTKDNGRNVEQIEACKTYAAKNGYRFCLWTEEHSGLENEHEIIKWATKYMAETLGMPDWSLRKKESGRRRAKKHYHEKIKTDLVAVDCAWCEKEHNVLRKSYDANLNKNGRYVCESEGGFIAGSLPKLHLRKENPYASQGLKECTNPNCEKKILPFSEFSPDKSRRDGYCSQCKTCRRKKANERYVKKIDDEIR